VETTTSRNRSANDKGHRGVATPTIHAREKRAPRTHAPKLGSESTRSNLKSSSFSAGVANLGPRGTLTSEQPKTGLTQLLLGLACPGGPRAPWGHPVAACGTPTGVSTGQTRPHDPHPRIHPTPRPFRVLPLLGAAARARIEQPTNTPNSRHGRVGGLCHAAAIVAPPVRPVRQVRIISRGGVSAVRWIIDRTGRRPPVIRVV